MYDDVIFTGETIKESKGIIADIIEDNPKLCCTVAAVVAAGCVVYTFRKPIKEKLKKAKSWILD